MLELRLVVRSAASAAGVAGTPGCRAISQALSPRSPYLRCQVGSRAVAARLFGEDTAPAAARRGEQLRVSLAEQLPGQAELGEARVRAQRLRYCAS